VEEMSCDGLSIRKASYPRKRVYLSIPLWEPRIL